MKKITAILLAFLCAVFAAGCAGNNSASEKKGEGVMTHKEYLAAENGSPAVIEAYVQARQSWWDGKATVYAQDRDGGYFIYNMACPKADFDALAPGTKIKVTGTKTEVSGEIQLIDGVFEVEEGAYIAEPLDATAMLGSGELIQHQNEYVSFAGMRVEKITDGAGNEFAFLYGWSGAGEDGSDLYFNVSKNGEVYTFLVESYLCGPDSDVYRAVKRLRVGDVIDMEGFLCWFEGVSPHITSITVVG